MNADLGFLADHEKQVRDRIVRALDQGERNEFDWHWGMSARPEQLPPPGDWRIWMVMAGRGFGKTRAGAEWVRSIAESQPGARIALVSSSLNEVRSVMIEGESGIIACSPPDRRPTFEPSLRRLRFPNGAVAHMYSSAEPETLRGPQHSHACRATFCGLGCGLSAQRYTSIRQIIQVDEHENRIELDSGASPDVIDGHLRLLAGPQTGLTFGILDVAGPWLTLDRPIVSGTQTGTRVELREGCDHTFSTCSGRFDNAANFRGEPFVPGNDLLARYGRGS